jgi:hypothetical protein
MSHGQVAVGSGPSPKGGAEVWLVRYLAQPQETEVKDGENRGVTVIYRNVAVGLQRLGTWKGRPSVYPLPEVRAGKDGDQKLAVLLQARATGRILGALKP